MRTLILANPNAGSLDSPDQLENAVRTLPDAHVHFTETPGEAETLARESLDDDWDCVVAAGGDGTVHEVANGVARDFSRVVFGVLPLGTGNDLARSLGMPLNLEKAIEVLAKGHTKKVDVIRVTFGEDADLSERYCLNMATGGFSGDVNETLDEDVKANWGPLSYLRSAVQAMPELKSFQLNLEPWDREALSLSAFSVAVANGRCVASGVPATPEASLDDGLLDVLVIPEMSVPKMALLAPQVLTGLHMGSELIRFLRTEKVTVRSEPPFPFNLDGEVCGETPATFEVLPRVLRIVIGPGAA